jgi:methionyl-tRNA synthetase
MEKKNLYLTTTLPYVNADPHIGFGLELVQADALVRYWKLMGHDVFFNTGTDEHGQKIAEKADEKGESRQGYVDHYAGEVKKLVPALGIDPGIHFVRTTDEHHKHAAQELWKRCEANGDIYKKKYSGLYCVGDEMFMKESELVDGRCPNHPNLELKEIEEENYFFKLSNYQGYLENEYLAEEGVIVPEWRRQEALNFVKQGLEDFSISREKSRLDWGVPVPGDENQVMYVWFDALTNYISTLGWPEDTEGNYKKFWEEGEPMQMAGKDQVRFQSIMWQAMLKSAELGSTHRVVYHGFINSGGQKMSKSLGNVISPFDLVKKYGTDATRYLLLRHVHPFDDTDITWDRLDEWYTAGLVNGLGNLVSRVMKMSEDNNVVTIMSHESYPTAIKSAMESFEFHESLNYIWSRLQRIDQKITEEEPFKVIKTDPVLGKAMIQSYVQELNIVSELLIPIMPNTAQVIGKAVRENKKPENLFPRLT